VSEIPVRALLYSVIYFRGTRERPLRYGQEEKNMDKATELQNAYRAYWDALGTQEAPSQEEFNEAYKGVYSSFEEFVDDNGLIDELTADWPDKAKMYFDKKSYIEDLQLNYLIAEGQEEAYGVTYSILYVFDEN
jgi:antirestriction protein